MALTRPCGSRRNCVSRQTSRKSGFASRAMGCLFHRSNLTGRHSLRCKWMYRTIFSRTVTILLRRHASRYDGVHAGYRYLQLHHQALTGDTGRKIRETRRDAERVGDYCRGVTLWRRERGVADAPRAGRGVFGTTCDSRLNQRSHKSLRADSH